MITLKDLRLTERSQAGDTVKLDIEKILKAAAIERIKAYQESDAVYARDIHGAFRRCKLQARIDELMEFFNLTEEDLRQSGVVARLV